MAIRRLACRIRSSSQVAGQEYGSSRRRSTRAFRLPMRSLTFHWRFAMSTRRYVHVHDLMRTICPIQVHQCPPTLSQAHPRKSKPPQTSQIGMAMTCLTIGAQSLTRLKGGVAFQVMQLHAGSLIIILEAELDGGASKLPNAYRAGTKYMLAISRARSMIRLVTTRLTYIVERVLLPQSNLPCV